MVERDDKLYSRIGIYGIRNIENNKIYIGKTGMNFGDRWDSHRCLLKTGNHDNKHLQNSWNKYGEEKFEFIIIEDCDVNLLNEREIYWIKYYKDLKLAYNIHNGGDGGINLGKHLSEETKRKIGEKNRINGLGRVVSEETKTKMSQSHAGKKYNKMSEQGLKNIIEAHQKYAIDHPKKISKDDVIQIRLQYSQGDKTYSSIAREYNVSSQCISDICNYKRWKTI